MKIFGTIENPKALLLGTPESSCHAICATIVLEVSL
jgi:hypothetical protein